jgi:serine/threonine protein kinase
LKPANVLLDEAGATYVADFGLAPRLENTLAIENDEVSGTPAYMAPEQAQVRASKLTRTTDIWGLGAILYELLTGEPPFRAETAQDTVKLVLEGRCARRGVFVRRCRWIWKRSCCIASAATRPSAIRLHVHWPMTSRASSKAVRCRHAP